ncbi:MAG: hypothetical protein R3240_06135 [Gammaproteobacteria bacterium]|nr:hypothetical protein [Gammaproteobacteria bacterium]
MKLKKITAGVATAVASSGVFALPATTTPDMEVFVSGASAQDNALKLLFADLCVAGTLDTYLDNKGGTKLGKAHSAYFCTIDASKVTGMASNQNVLFHKRSAGGSGQGVQPVADSAPIEAMMINNGNCTATGTANEFECTVTNPGDTAMKVSDAGISDVEPGLFVAPNVPAGFTPVTAAQLAKLVITSQTAVVFGEPVSLNLRNALQTAQFGSGSACIGDDSEACMPSLTREQIASLHSGQIKTWDQFSINGTPLPQVSGVVAPAADFGGKHFVNICRRVEGSGTQAQHNAKFLGVPCVAGSAPPLTLGHPLNGPTVTLNSGSGDVEVCLNDANANGKWAVGLQATEKNSTLTSNYRFIKVDGVAPTLKNVAEGKYFDWVENSIQWRNAANNGPSGDMLALLQTIAKNAGSPTIVKQLNTKFVHPFGQAGYLALSSNGHAPSVPFNATTNPVNPYSHVIGGAVNNCRVPQTSTISDIQM